MNRSERNLAVDDQDFVDEDEEMTMQSVELALSALSSRADPGVVIVES